MRSSQDDQLGAPGRDAIFTECLVRSVASAAPRESAPQSAQSVAAGWRTPAVVIVCGCLIAAVAFGPRSALGFFLTPLSSANHWGRDVFAFALAVQNLLWGAAQPVAGAIADRFGAVRVLSAGAILYALGLVLMAHSSNAAMLDLSAGALIGFGLSGTTFPIVLAPSARYCRPNGARPLSVSERRQALSVSSSFRRSLFS